MLWYLKEHELKKVETARYTISTAKQGGKLPLIIDEEYPAVDLPEHYQKVSIEPDTQAIRAALEEGATLPFARLGTRAESLRIK